VVVEEPRLAPFALEIVASQRPPPADEGRDAATTSAQAATRGSVSGFVAGGRWQIGEEPWIATQQVVDGVTWGYALRRGEERRSVVVIVSRKAWRLMIRGCLPVETREAIATEGRSEAERAAELSDPPACVVLGTAGYMPAPATLQRLGEA
jgi:hypothetical protein